MLVAIELTPLWRTTFAETTQEMLECSLLSTHCRKVSWVSCFLEKAISSVSRRKYDLSSTMTTFFRPTHIQLNTIIKVKAGCGKNQLIWYK